MKLVSHANTTCLRVGNFYKVKKKVCVVLFVHITASFGVRQVVSHLNIIYGWFPINHQLINAKRI